jgi:1-phosphofructokinase family hexose kinase
VNPNPIFDRTITVPAVVPGAVIRALDVELTAGGKGINVARALRALGNVAPIVLPVGGADAEEYQRLLQGEGADYEILPVPGRIRVATILREIDTNRVTVVNEPGDMMMPAEWQVLRDMVASSISAGDRVLCMGSMPRGLPVTSLGELIETVHQRGASILIDSTPDHLAAALSYEPDLVCPNVHEAEAALDSSYASVMDETGAHQSRARAEEAARKLCARGARGAVVTAGEAGAAFSDGTVVIWVEAPPVRVVSPVGAGDSFVAGLAHLWMRDEGNWEGMVQSGVAAASASCEQVLAGGVSRARYEELLALLESRERVA